MDCAQLTYELDYGEDNPEWDVLVERCSGASYEQTTSWAKVKRANRWQIYRILVRQENRLIGGTQVQHRRVGRIASLGFISGGPVFSAPEAAAPVTLMVIKALRQTAHTYFTVLSGYACAAVIPALQAHGFFAKPNLLPPSNLVTATTVIDLNRELDVTLARMRRKTRQNIRRGLEGGVKVSLGDEADLPVFFRLMCQLCARRGQAPDPPTIETFLEYWRYLAPAGMVKVFVGRYQSEPVVAAVVFVFGDSIWARKIGWSGEHEKQYPNDLLIWEMIKWAKEAGLRRFDFVQIMPEHARAILRGEAIEDHYAGVTHFKMGFGGDLLVIPDSYYRSFNPVVHVLCKLGGARLIASPWFLKWVGRLFRSRTKGPGETG